MSIARRLRPSGTPGRGARCARVALWASLTIALFVPSAPAPAQELEWQPLTTIYTPMREMLEMRVAGITVTAYIFPGSRPANSAAAGPQSPPVARAASQLGAAAGFSRSLTHTACLPGVPLGPLWPAR